jgi:AraC-like DNA-binding protein
MCYDVSSHESSNEEDKTMNVTALMTHVSQKLHTIVRRYSRNGELLESVCERYDINNSIEKDWTDNLYKYPGMEIYLLQSTLSNYPKVSVGSDNVSYVTITTDDFRFLIGPVVLTYGTKYTHQIPACKYREEWVLSLYFCDLLELVTEILLIHNLFHDDMLTVDDVIAFNCLTEKDRFEVQKTFTNIIFEYQECSQKHNPYDREVREVSSIREGNLIQLEKSIAEDYIGTPGTLAKTPLRNYQDLAIVIITLASRAAIEGGVMAEIAYSLSDSYIQRVEDQHVPEAAVQLARQAERQYTSMVKEINLSKKNPSRYGRTDSRISQCKDYIFTHLHGKLSTAQIAKALYINPNYLSNLFKKIEGITITEYILRAKIELAKNMLIYSQNSYSTIATYLGFSSQSHLGRNFKKSTGMTMHQYRETYGKKDFFATTESPQEVSTMKKISCKL